MNQSNLTFDGSLSLKYQPLQLWQNIWQLEHHRLGRDKSVKINTILA